MGFHLVAAGPGRGTEFLNAEGYPVVHGGRCRCVPRPMRGSRPERTDLTTWRNAVSLHREFMLLV